ncbi:hypothetical protein [Deferrisoma palaeochoriense]
MPLLADYAITPDVFDATSYPSEELGRAYLQPLKEVLLSEGLVRDLRNGEWLEMFRDSGRPWHRHGKELVKKLAQQGRLVQFQSMRNDTPADDVAWCEEAIGTHQIFPFTGGIIVTESVKDRFADNELIARIDRLPSASWWARRRSSVRLARNLDEYLKHLNPLLRCANSLMFIDPHLDPARPGYREFGQLLQASGGRRPPPTIQIHRVAWFGSSRDKRPQCEELEVSFRAALTDPLRANGLRIEVFLWDDFHDRYLISNLVGISLPNGFDTTTNPNAVTTWARISREDRDDVQREFDPASGRHTLHARFEIPPPD